MGYLAAAGPSRRHLDGERTVQGIPRVGGSSRQVELRIDPRRHCIINQVGYSYVDLEKPSFRYGGGPGFDCDTRRLAGLDEDIINVPAFAVVHVSRPEMEPDFDSAESRVIGKVEGFLLPAVISCETGRSRGERVEQVEKDCIRIAALRFNLGPVAAGRFDFNDSTVVGAPLVHGRALDPVVEGHYGIETEIQGRRFQRAVDPAAVFSGSVPAEFPAPRSAGRMIPVVFEMPFILVSGLYLVMGPSLLTGFHIRAETFLEIKIEPRDLALENRGGSGFGNMPDLGSPELVFRAGGNRREGVESVDAALARVEGRIEDRYLSSCDRIAAEIEHVSLDAAVGRGVEVEVESERFSLRNGDLLRTILVTEAGRQNFKRFAGGSEHPVVSILVGYGSVRCARDFEFGAFYGEAASAGPDVSFEVSEAHGPEQGGLVANTGRIFAVLGRLGGDVMVFRIDESFIHVDDAVVVRVGVDGSAVRVFPADGRSPVEDIRVIFIIRGHCPG